MYLLWAWVFHIVQVLSCPLRYQLTSIAKHPSLTGWLGNVIVIGPLVMTPILWTAQTEMPSSLQVAIDLFGAYFIYNAGFYWMHRWVHAYAYEWHKQHHSYVILDHPWSAFDASWVEHSLVNVLPFAVACWVMNASQVSCIIMGVLGTENSMRSHMGLSPFHARHHAHKHVNFGVLDLGWISLWDSLAGTAELPDS